MGWIARAIGAVVLVSVVTCVLVVSGASGQSRPPVYPVTLLTSRSVVHGRFTVQFELDGGVVGVVPAPRKVRPTMSLAAARVLMRANTNTMSDRSIVLGYGLATISTHAPGVPRVRSLLAWVGISKRFASESCPMMRATTGTATTTLPSLPSAGYAAFVIGATHGSPAVTYVAESAPCGSVVRSTLTNASEAISLPWQALGPVAGGSLQVRTTIPTCGSFAGVTTGGSARSMTITLGAVVPDVHGPCQGAKAVTKVVTFGPNDAPGAPPPLVSASTHLVHGTVGPLNLESPG
jgi:hypothetical protein